MDPTEVGAMGSISKKTKRIRRNKRISAGASRKRDIRKAQREQSEKRLEEALGEKFKLANIRG